MNTGFAEKWRKRQACRRCRRIKVRCEFDSPDSDTCTRCAKAGVECQLNPPAGSESLALKSHRRGAKYAWVETKAVYTEAARAQKIAELEQVVEDARTEIAQLRGSLQGPGGPIPGQSMQGPDPHGALQIPPPTSLGLPGSLNSGHSRQGSIVTQASFVDPALAGIDPTLDPMASADVVAGALAAARDPSQVTASSTVAAPASNMVSEGLEGAIRGGIITRQDAQRALVAGTNLAVSRGVPYSGELPRDLETTPIRNEPVLTLTIVAIGAASLNMSCSESLVTLLGSVLGDRVLSRGNSTLELARAAVLYAQFGTTTHRSREDSYLSLAVSLARCLDLGSPQDVRALSFDDGHPGKDSARARIHTLIHIYEVAALYGLSNSSSITIRVLDSIPKLTAAIVDGLPSVHKTQMQLIEQGQRVIEEIAAGVGSEEDDGDDGDEKLLIQFNDVVKGSPDAEAGPFKDFTLLIELSVYETALFRQLLRSDSRRSAISDKLSLVANKASQVLDVAVTPVKRNDSTPSFVFIVAIRAISALIRVRMVSWLLALDTMSKDVNSLYTELRHAWAAHTSQSWFIAQLHPLYLRIERWLGIHLIKGNNKSLIQAREQILGEILNRVDLTRNTSAVLNGQEEDYNVDPSLAGLTGSVQPATDNSNKFEGSIDPSTVFYVSGPDPTYNDIGLLLKDLFQDVTEIFI